MLPGAYLAHYLAQIDAWRRFSVIWTTLYQDGTAKRTTEYKAGRVLDEYKMAGSGEWYSMRSGRKVQWLRNGIGGQFSYVMNDACKICGDALHPSLVEEGIYAHLGCERNDAPLIYGRKDLNR